MISAASLHQNKVLGWGGDTQVGRGDSVAGRFFLFLENVVTDFYFPQWHAWYWQKDPKGLIE